MCGGKRERNCLGGRERDWEGERKGGRKEGRKEGEREMKNTLSNFIFVQCTLKFY